MWDIAVWAIHTRFPMSSTARHTLPCTTWESVLAEQFHCTPFFSYLSSSLSVITPQKRVHVQTQHFKVATEPFPFPGAATFHLCQTLPQQPQADVSSCWDTLACPAPALACQAHLGNAGFNQRPKSSQDWLFKKYLFLQRRNGCVHFILQHLNTKTRSTTAKNQIVLRSLKLLMGKIQGRTQVTLGKIHSSGFLIKPRKSISVLADG